MMESTDQTFSSGCGLSMAGGVSDTDWDRRSCDYQQLNLSDNVNFIDPSTDIDPDSMFAPYMNMDCKYYSDNDINSRNLTGLLSIIHFNCRSMYANFSGIKDYLSQFTHAHSIIAISETWFSESKGIEFELEGYDLHYVCRVNKAGGGVAIYVQRNLKAKIVEKMSIAVNDVLECVTVEIQCEKGSNMVVSCIYRSPTSKVDEFTVWMDKIFMGINKKLFICGDFNIDLINPKNHSTTDDFMDKMLSLSLYPTITSPTRITSGSATLIDNIFTNDIENPKCSGILTYDITDHLPIFLLINSPIKTYKNEQKFIFKRTRNDKSIEEFKDDLLKQDWSGVYSGSDVNNAYDSFLKIFCSSYNRLCPVRRCIRGKNNSKGAPWLTKGLQNACKKKNFLYRQFLKLRTVEAESRYKRYKNKLTNIIRASKKAYYNEALMKNKGNVRAIWGILKEVMNKNNKKNAYPDYFTDKEGEVNNMQSVVNRFNDYFVNVGPNLANSIPIKNNEELGVSLIDRVPGSFFVAGTTEGEIKSIVSKFKNKASTDCHDIDMILIKKVIDTILKPLTHICNLSLLTGTFPDKMKMAKVIPMYKSDDEHAFNNYRPVSLLPQFSKILEKLFNKRLVNFIEKHKIIHESQYGFRAKRSTSMAIMEAVEGITDSLECRKSAIGVFIDLKKAFDTIDHSILLNKLERYGIRGVAWNWIDSYLKERQQFVRMGEFKSDYRTIVCGVPQGSILGPVLFNLYINDIFKVSKLVQLILFADDTNIFFASEDYNTAIEVMNVELRKLKNWMDVNKLSLNLSKTKAMVFGNQNVNHELPIVVNGVEIKKVTETTFLGITIDSKLSWKTHIRNIRRKLSKNIFMINKAKYFLDLKALYVLYCCLVQPYLTYGIEIWGNTYKSSLLPLFKLQKRAIRIIHKVGYLDHTNRLFASSELLKLPDLVTYSNAQVLYRASRQTLPMSLQRFFTVREGRYNLRGENNFVVRAVRTTRKSFCVSVCGVRQWNNLEGQIKLCSNTIQQFKQKYKEMVLKQYKDEKL